MANFPNNNWRLFFEQAKEKGLFASVTKHIQSDISDSKVIFPPSHQIFRAFELCDWEILKVVVLGQDPYHGDGEANGLCFSVNSSVRNPPSLQNIFKEIKNSYPEFDIHRSSDISDWSEQGVLLLNAVLTVEKDKPASHSSYGWQEFTDSVISEISDKKDFVIFLLLGNFAKSKIPLIDNSKHTIITAAHPSPFSAHKGFLNSNVFKLCNEALHRKGFQEIRW